MGVPPHPVSPVAKLWLLWSAMSLLHMQGCSGWCCALPPARLRALLPILCLSEPASVHSFRATTLQEVLSLVQKMGGLVHGAAQD